MAKKDDRFLSTRKEAIGKRPWPNLPQQLLKLTCKETKLAPTDELSGHHQVLDNGNKAISPPPHFWGGPTPHFLGYSQGLLIQRGPNPSDFQVYQVSTRVYWILPPWDVSVPFKFATISCSLNSLNCVVVLTGITSPAFVVFNRSQGECVWIRHECTTVDPYDAKKQIMQFTNIIGFEGKFYALSLQGALAVMEEINSRLVITTIGTSRAVPSVSARYFKEYLLESNGEILLIFLIYRKTAGVVDRVEVFWLHIPKLSWIKLESLQEKALFLENECCTWVDSSQVGCRGNCVYFSQSALSAANGWCTYDMESRCISPGLIATSLPWNEPKLEE
ncbi:hypothetical protein Pfo_016835 [Paulownia fortunei]|nr:hypothetical protein Pfo_016835 [Paulownia fortunei]